MTIKTDYILTALHVISWILFIGLSIEAGGFITSTFATLFLEPQTAARVWHQVNLTPVYQYNETRYITLSSIMIIVAVLKALMFYTIVRMFHSKKIDLIKPFNAGNSKFVLLLSYLVIGIGLFSYWGMGFADQLAADGVTVPDLRYLKLAGADVWLFTGVLLLVIAFVFKKGVEIQTENDLTV